MPADHTSRPTTAGWSCDHPVIPERGHLDYAIDHTSAEKLRLHSGGGIEIKRHPAEVALHHKAFVWWWGRTLQQFEVTGDLSGAEIRMVEILPLRRATPCHLLMLLY